MKWKNIYIYTSMKMINNKKILRIYKKEEKNFFYY